MSKGFVIRERSWRLQRRTNCNRQNRERFQGSGECTPGATQAFEVDPMSQQRIEIGNGEIATKY